jgi:hypothetical protein
MPRPDYPGGAYDPDWWAEVGMWPPAEIYVRPCDSDAYPSLAGRYSCGAYCWVPYPHGWDLDSIETSADSLAEGLRTALAYGLELELSRPTRVLEARLQAEGRGHALRGST